ncbi:MAG TPA: DEAD/DEAH box helicase, partial [Candidatus Tumulicola sp.]
MMERFNPLISDWFEQRLGKPTEPQIQAWPIIADGGDVLLAAPTGSGKTLAAFLTSLDALIRRAEAGDLPDRTLVVYVSPLKALTNDVRKNLEIPLAELTAAAENQHLPLQTIRTAVRTGDTTAAQRRQMLSKAPHVLVTTPESLFILLTAEKSRALFSDVSTVIVDEIHAVANSKRGSHLMLTLARLDALVTSSGAPRPQRIGLSATVAPIETIGEFLSDRTAIVNVGSRRDMELSIAVPSDELGAVASGEMWAEIYDRVAETVLAHRTTLIFVPTRRMSERVAFALSERLGEGVVLPHHGSLAREARFEAENRLKDGAIRAVVATASLELGIDIGTVDVVVQLGTPRSIATALQRIGRSGHWVGATPRGILYATTRDELLECMALIRALRYGGMDALEIPEPAFDILAQQIVAACASHEWKADDLFAAVRSTYSYRNLTRADFDAVVALV